MSEPITEQDIQNWQCHILAKSNDQLTGNDLFLSSCLDEIVSLRRKLSMKDDALQSHAEIYQQIAHELGFDDDLLSGGGTDNIILNKLHLYKQSYAEVERLHDRIDELIPQCDAAYAPYREMVQVARAEVDKFSSQLAEARGQYELYFGLYKSICFPLKPAPPFIVGS